MGKGDVLKGEIDSDAPINVYFMNGTNFDKYHRDKTFEYEGPEDFWKGLVEFRATKQGNWYLVLENEGKESVKVKVHLYI